MQGKKQYQEKLFVNFQLSDHVPEDNFYRRLKNLLPLQWLYESTQKYYGKEGQQSIDPVVFFKLILIGYLENLCSDRRIINTVQLRLDLLYFIGYDLDEPLPWHSTLSRTRQLYGEDVFKELFKKVLGLCIEAGMVTGKRQAIDSIAVQANASMESLQKKEIFADADVYVNELESMQKEETKNRDNAGDQEIPDNPNARDKKISNSKMQSTTDPDARVSVKPGKIRRLNYLAQVSVDTATHVITQIQSDYADKKDSQCLPSLLNNTIENLREHNLHVEEVLADGNYSSSEALRVLEQYRVTGYIPNFGQYKPQRKDFEYDNEEDCYICGAGNQLAFKGMRKTRGGKGQMKQYRSNAKDCAECPSRSICIGNGQFKTIAVTTDKELFDKMHQRLQKPEATIMRKLRSSTVEPVLGTLVNFLGMRRVNTKGILQASKCMMMAAIAYNLKKLVKSKFFKLLITFLRINFCYVKADSNIFLVGSLLL
jgi:transposase/flagellar biosynthesis/type III secretory pathway chaperone